MKNVKALNLKNMKETIVNYSGDQKEFDKIWDAFIRWLALALSVRLHGGKFSDQCAGWYVDEENACVRDDCNCPSGFDAIVWEYTPDAEYIA